MRRRVDARRGYRRRIARAVMCAVRTHTIVRTSGSLLGTSDVLMNAEDEVDCAAP